MFLRGMIRRYGMPRRGPAFIAQIAPRWIARYRPKTVVSATRKPG